MTSRYELSVYVLILGVNFLWTFFIYMFAHSMCTGTGMGGNQVLRLCQDYAPWLAFAVNALLFVGVLGFTRILGLTPSYRKVITGCVTLGILILSYIIWDSSFFLTSGR